MERKIPLLIGLLKRKLGTLTHRNPDNRLIARKRSSKADFGNRFFRHSLYFSSLCWDLSLGLIQVAFAALKKDHIVARNGHHLYTALDPGASLLRRRHPDS